MDSTSISLVHSKAGVVLYDHDPLCCPCRFSSSVSLFSEQEPLFELLKELDEEFVEFVEEVVDDETLSKLRDSNDSYIA